MGMFVHQLTEFITSPPAHTRERADEFLLTSFYCGVYLELCCEVLWMDSGFGLIHSQALVVF